jgi:hypothetical protein
MRERHPRRSEIVHGRIVSTEIPANPNRGFTAYM